MDRLTLQAMHTELQIHTMICMSEKFALPRKLCFHTAAGFETFDHAPHHNTTSIQPTTPGSRHATNNPTNKMKIDISGFIAC
jgi:hypothetical protein